MNSKIFALDAYEDFDSAYWGLGKCSDGNIYFGLCSHIPGKSAGFFKFDPKNEKIEHLFNVDEILGGVHGKIHTPILEGSDGKLYFGTHFAYAFGDPSQVVSYEGGHLVSYDPKNGQAEDIGIASEGEGILTIALNRDAGKIYSLTVPGGILTETDIQNSSTRELGIIPSKGSICRTITVGDTGKVYGSFESNGLFIYDPTSDDLILKRDYFPKEQIKEWDDPTRGGVNKIGRNLWRCADYDRQRYSLYGIYSASSRAFRIDCETLELEFFDQLVPETFAEADTVYPTLTMTSNSKQVFYAPADGMFDYCRSDNLKNFTQLMVLDKNSGSLSSIGEICDSGQRVFGAAGAVMSQDYIYLLGATETIDFVTHNGGKKDSLFYIEDKPFKLSLIQVKV